MNETAILTGSGKGDSMFIAMCVPRNYSFQFKRLQFQIILHFTITSNESQQKVIRTFKTFDIRKFFNRVALKLAILRILLFWCFKKYHPIFFIIDI